MPLVASPRPLASQALYTACHLDHMQFDTTDDVKDLDHFLGQARVLKALDLGVSIKRKGYNIYALGPSGVGKHTLARGLAEEQAAQEPPPSDWVYVNNFAQPSKPRALRLPPGTAVRLKQDMERLIEELRTSLSAAFESEEYQTRRRALEAEFQEQQQESLKGLQEKAKEKGLALLRTPGGLAFAPLREGEVLPPEEFQKLPQEEQTRLEAEVDSLQQELQAVLLKVPRWERDFRARLRELQQEVSGFVLADVMEELYAKYKDLANVTDYLHAVQDEVSQNLGGFMEADEEKPGADAQEASAPVLPDGLKVAPALRRYLVNVLVDASQATGAPVLYESNPTYLNLVGRVEQMAMMGALVTDFTLIKPGVLHQANGGYLILDALKVLTSPYAWEGLKRALQFGEIRIESPMQMMSLTSTVSLEPEPIPLDIKVILVGDRMLYYMLAQSDPEFGELFKVTADFDDEFVRNEEVTEQYAHLIAAMVRKEELLPFEKGAVCRVIEAAARQVEDAERLTTRMRNVVDLMEEADHWAARPARHVCRRNMWSRPSKPASTGSTA